MKNIEELKIFYCYARKDKKLREQLGKHLEPLKQKHRIITFCDAEILPGKNWEKEIDKSLSNSDIILILVSADFISSNYCYNIEMQKAFEMAEAGKILIIPIILRPCAWETTPLYRIQALPKEGKPVVSWDDLDEAFYNIFQGVDKVIEDLKNADKPLHYEFDSIYHLKDRISEILFAGQDISRYFFDFLESFSSPLQYHTLFIGYAHSDQALATRLHADLQNKGVRCWFAPHDLRPGDKIRSRIDEAIHIQDKTLLLLSERAIASSWVEFEVEATLEKEYRQKRLLLLPIRLDESVMHTEQAWAVKLRNTRYIGGFTHWTNPLEYQQALERLIHDLKV